MKPPCDTPCGSDGPAAVFGYGDANADFHLVGDCPSVHGGTKTGIPFTDTRQGEALLSVFADVGLLTIGAGGNITPKNLFCSYLHMCCLPDQERPTAKQYGELEPFFDAELRAIAAHVLCPVGETATRHVFDQYTAREGTRTLDMTALHATEVRGSGFLVVPIMNPSEWVDTDADRLRACLQSVLARDYRQVSELGRFIATEDQYLVR